MSRRESGFTLIEILVVLAIIAMLVSMATINTSHDGRFDDLKTEAEKLKFKLMATSDEALFKNKNLGLEFAKTQLKAYSYETITKTNSVSASSSTGSSPSSGSSTLYSKEWQPFSGKYISNYVLPDGYSLQLKVEGQEIQLPFVLKENQKPENVKPNTFIFASGEQTPIELTLYIDEYEGYANIRGDGMGRFFSEVFNEEE